MLKCILFIDGENFLHKVKDVLRNEDIDIRKIDLASIDLNKLFLASFKKIEISRKIIYFSRLRFHKDTQRKSEELIKFQRKLRNNLVNQGYEFILAGNIRAQKVGDRIIFREKGVDVRIAVDMVSLACDKKMEIAILCSSDSDLQSAVAETKKRKVKVVYAGFEMWPNIGLTKTTDSSVLFRKSEIIAICPKKKIIFVKSL